MIISIASRRLRQRKVFLSFAICVFIWGSTWLVIITQLRSDAATWSVFYRFTIGAVAMAILCMRRGIDLRLDRSGHRQALLIGIPLFGLNYLLVYVAEAYIPSGLVALISALLIVPNAVFGCLLLGQNISRRFLLGSALAIGGISLLLAENFRHAPAGVHTNWRGILSAGGAVMAASISNLVQASSKARAFHTLALLTWGMVYGALFDGAVAWAIAGAPRFPLDPVYLAGLFYLAICGSVLGFSIYFAMLREIGPARASYVSALTPIVAMTLSTFFEAYRWTTWAAAGCALALAGLVIANRSGEPA